MWVIPRKKGEGIVVGDRIRITVLAIQDGRVRLGIERPPEPATKRRSTRKERPSRR